jgi:hypothetical protein
MCNKKKRKSSGGVVANNYRQGSRAEIIAQYFFSEFCIAERVLKENDFGIDLYCSLMDVSGLMGYTSTLFGVQIKSGEATFQYSGESVSAWLKQINVPLLMCRVNRDELSVAIYSTWAINSLLSGNENFTKISFIESYSSPDNNENLKMPEVTGSCAIVWMGPPIIKCTLNDLINNTIPKDEIREILKEWVSFESENYAKRHLGTPVYYGYQKWNTNQSLKTSQRVWYRPHVFNEEYSKKAIHRILEASALIALNQGKENPFVDGIAELLKNNNIVSQDDMDSWQKEKIGINKA